MTLYKYFPLRRLENIFKDKLVRFTQPDALNDPCEMRPYIQSLMTSETWETEIRAKAEQTYTGAAMVQQVAPQAWSKLNRRERRFYKSIDGLIEKLTEYARAFPDTFKATYLVYFNALVHSAIENQKELIQAIPDTINKTVGVFSLSATPTHPLMWAHYAEAFGGFVVGFDETCSLFSDRYSEEDEIGGLHEIIYDLERANMAAFIDFNDEHLKSLTRKMFFTKGSDWTYEQEWRVVKRLKDADKKNGEIHLFSLPPQCITEVILGYKLNPEVRQQIIKLIQVDSTDYWQVKLYEAAPCEETYDIDLRLL